MPCLGSWPFQHTITLEKLYKDNKIKMIYCVDTDKIISYQEALELKKNNWILYDIYFIISSKEMNDMCIYTYINQIIPSPIPQSVSNIIEQNMDLKFREILKEIKSKSLTLILSDQDDDSMKMLGCEYNTYIGCWIGDCQTIKKALKEGNRNHLQKPTYEISKIGGTLIIKGNVSGFEERLKSVDGCLNKNNNTWQVPSIHFHQIKDIFQ